MKANKAAPTGEWKENSTVFADVEPMVLDGASVRVYDCAGQVTDVLTRRGVRSRGCPIFKLLKTIHMGFEYMLYATFARHDVHFDRSRTRGCCRCF